MNIFTTIKSFILTHKLASIITASVVGVGAIGGTTAGIIYSVNNDNDSQTEYSANTTNSTTDMLVGQVIDPATLTDTVEEVQSDGTVAIKDKNGVVVATKDASGKTTLTNEGATSVASGNMAANIGNYNPEVAQVENNSFTTEQPQQSPNTQPQQVYQAPQEQQPVQQPAVTPQAQQSVTYPVYDEEIHRKNEAWSYSERTLENPNGKETVDSVDTVVIRHHKADGSYSDETIVTHSDPEWYTYWSHLTRGVDYAAWMESSQVLY